MRAWVGGWVGVWLVRLVFESEHVNGGRCACVCVCVFVRVCVCVCARARGTEVVIPVMG